MEIRGERECTACGTRWSYYETGEITCPACGSVQSRGLDDPTEHTAGAAEFDLSAVRQTVDDDPLSAVADKAADHARAYIRQVGFVHAGELQPLDDTYLAATELRRVATTLGRLMQVADDERLYVLALLRADTGDRPAPDAVPETFHPERGLAVAAAVDAYLSDVRRVTKHRDPELDRALSTITARRKRIEALDGAIDPGESEQLVRAVRDLSTHLREGDETALVRVTERFE